MINISQVSVGATATLIGTFGNENVTLTVGATAVTLGSSTAVTTSNGAPTAANTVVPLGKVTGSLYGIVASGSAPVGLIVTSAL